MFLKIEMRFPMSSTFEPESPIIIKSIWKSDLVRP